MAVFVLAGEFGSGKTTLLKHYLKKIDPKKKRMLFALVKNDLGSDIIKSSKEFFAEAVNSKDTCMIIDEARIALPKSIPDNPGEHDLRILTTFINARKLNNIIFIVYHSLGEIPLWLLKYTDILLRFRTKDQLQYQRARFASFANIVESIDNFPSIEKFEHDQIILNN